MGAMTRDSRRAGISLGVLILAFALEGPGLARGEEGPSAKPFWVGTGSCSAMSCHNGRREPLALKGSEYSFSAAYDSHAKAFSVLYDDRSKRIEKLLRRIDRLEDADATTDDLCLKCHVHQGYDSKQPQRSVEFSNADGAGCEGCHGPASNWLLPHTEGGFKSLSDQDKYELYGLRPTKDLAARAQICTECHVGLKDADVNHDLIAAGHPRLNFEYTNQLGKYPKHWYLADDKARHPDYEAKAWALGQLVAARAALDLLAYRAEKSIPDDSTAPWPEFSESSCFSCHQTVKKDVKTAILAGGPRPGNLPWGTWFFALPKTVGEASGFELEPFGSPINLLRAEMSQPIPDAKLVALEAREASAQLGVWIDGINRGQLQPGEIKGLLDGVLKDQAARQTLDWDRAAQDYLAIVALGKSLVPSDPRYGDLAAKSGLSRLQLQLNLPIASVGNPKILDSPISFDPASLRGEFQAIKSALPNP
jgi:hypothetical protein